MNKETKSKALNLFLNLKRGLITQSGSSNVPVPFDKQTAFICDRSPFVAALCTRRAGKSYGIAERLIAEASEVAGCSVLYVALTRRSAKEILWKDCLKNINRERGIGMRFNESSLVATLRNGSEIHLAGADTGPQEIDKRLGQKFKFAAIDECASFKQDLRRAVYGVLKPCVADYRGTVALIGTPSNVTTGLFYDITTGKESGWAVHKWTAFDNPYMADKWDKEIGDLRRLNPLITETPMFKQMYLGEWVIDTDRLCYKFYGEEKNLVDHMPAPHKKSQVFYVLGVDLGYDPDPSAFSLCAYSEHDRNLYVIDTYKRNKMIISDVAERIRYYQSKYPIHTTVIDASNKQAVEEMRQRYGISLVAAEKTSKAEFIEIMNSDLIAGQVKLVRSETEGLQSEWTKLVWDERSDKREEASGLDNHLADATLYAWRYSYNYIARPMEMVPSVYTEAGVEKFWNEEADRIERNKHAINF